MLTRVHVITAYGQSKSLLNKTITLLNQFAAKCRRSRAPSGPYSEIESIKSALYPDMRHPLSFRTKRLATLEQTTNVMT